ncbi:S-layer homology domain-containing protein [Paenibacillus sp. FSL R5-0912]|uniref:S-layer homology domain-containing protein n=1 Tax=Paenibacillus sp. FSL R5-0912 TaxID=1536771 RepID=UPI0004F5CA5F|nr:S-layer homology domain-containing protein [Paenibacillus sp. FSL R5-0912]AIQ39995.1 hypothetical protein R50912_08095 [Paenibacillus sp. FSL R5-0912]
MRTIKLVVAGLIAGTIAGAVTPDYPVRADSVSYEETADDNDTGVTSPIFPDIQGHWSERWVRWALGNQYITGYSDLTFRPDQPITEAEFLKVYYLSFGYPKATIFGEEWTAGPYRMAKNWKHPIPGLQDPQAQAAPITRQTAAQFIASALGKNYNDRDSIIFLLGNQLLPLPEEPTVEGFKGNATLTRAEALEWIRMLKLKGNILKPRPQELSDPGLLPPLTDKGTGLKDFTAVPVTEGDFGIGDPDGKLIMEWNSPRSLVEQYYGASTGQDVFNNEMYKDVSVHYDSSGKMDSWSVKADEDAGEPALTATLQHIRPGVSTLEDVLMAYGTYAEVSSTYGVILSYTFENMDGVLIPRLFPGDKVNTDRGYVMAFGFDEETLKVTHMKLSTLQRAINPDDN